MKYLSSITAMAAFCLVLMTSCNNDDDNNGDGRTAIRLSSNVELGTLRLQDNQIAQDQELSLFVTRNGNLESVLYSNQKITANGAGGFDYDQTMYYPTDGSNVDFYAIHPYTNDASLEEVLSFNVEEDQSDADDYLNSDLLYATRENVARTTSAVTMNFSHKLAKLDFVIIQGDGANISLLEEVTTLNVRPSTSIDLSTGTLGNAGGTATEIISYGVNDDNTPSNGRISGITAIVVPQTISAGRIFRIRLGNIDYFYTSTTGLSFEGGKKYTLELTINQASITLQSTITDWLDGGTITGDGSIE